MSPITLSVEALALLRRRLTQGDRRVDDSNREAYRELARAGIMCPVSGRTTGPESHYRFTAKGWRRRGIPRWLRLPSTIDPGGYRHAHHHALGRGRRPAPPPP